MNQRRFAIVLGAIAVAGFAVRLLAIATVASRNPDGGDPLYYHVQANLLADGHGFAEPFTWLGSGRIVASAMHPPLFSLVLASSSVFGGTGFFAHKVVASVAGTATVVVLGLLGRRLAGDRAGLLVAAIAAVYPNLWVIDGILMPEGLFGLTVAGVLLAAYRAHDRINTVRAVALGGAIGLAALARGEALLFVPLLLLPVARRSVRHAAVALGACVLVLAPWFVRNAVTFDDTVLLSVNSAEVIRNANCDLTWHGDLLGFWAFACYEGTPPARLDESARGSWWRRRGLEYVRDDIGHLPVVVAARVGRVWDVYRPLHNTHLATIEGRDLNVARAGLLSFWLSLPLAVAGAVALRRRRVPVWPLASAFVVVTVTAALAYGATRFRMPAEIALVVLAGIGVDRLIGAVRQRRSTSLPPHVAVAGHQAR